MESSLVRILQEFEVELLHVGPLEPAGLLLAAELVDALLEPAPLAQRAGPAGVPLAAPAGPAPPLGPLAQLDHVRLECNSIGKKWLEKPLQIPF